MSHINFGNQPAPAALKELKQHLQTVLDALADDLDQPAVRRDHKRIQSSIASLHSMRQDFGQIAHASVLQRSGSAMDKSMKSSHAIQTEATRIVSRILTLIDCVLEQISGTRIPLIQRIPVDHPVESQMRLVNFLMGSLQQFVNPAAQSSEAKEKNYHTDILLPQSRFMERLHAAYRVTLALRRKAPFRFLDVGCGGGTKVLTAAQVFERADGLEFDPAYANYADAFLKITSPYNSRLIQGDALTFDDYADYDVIYFFLPIGDTEKMIELEQRIAAQASPQTVLIAPYNSFATRAEAMGCHSIAQNVFVTQTTAEDARELTIEAEMIGLSMDRTVQLTGDDLLWEKIISTCLRNGNNPMRRP